MAQHQTGAPIEDTSITNPAVTFCGSILSQGSPLTLDEISAHQIRSREDIFCVTISSHQRVSPERAVFDCTEFFLTKTFPKYAQKVFSFYIFYCDDYDRNAYSEKRARLPGVWKAMNKRDIFGHPIFEQRVTTSSGFRLTSLHPVSYTDIARLSALLLNFNNALLFGVNKIDICYKSMLLYLYNNTMISDRGKAESEINWKLAVVNLSSNILLFRPFSIYKRNSESGLDLFVSERLARQARLLLSV